MTNLLHKLLRFIDRLMIDGRQEMYVDWRWGLAPDPDTARRLAERQHHARIRMAGLWLNPKRKR